MMRVAVLLVRFRVDNCFFTSSMFINKKRYAKSNDGVVRAAASPAAIARATIAASEAAAKTAARFELSRVVDVSGSCVAVPQNFHPL